MPHKLLPLLGLLALTPGLAQSAPAPRSAPTATELLQRFLSPDWTGDQGGTEVLVGQVPGNLGVALPAGSRVVGTVRTSFGQGATPTTTAVYFDTALTPQQVTAHFVKALGSGWQEATGLLNGPYEAQGGFQPSTSILNRAFYQKNPARLVQVSARAAAGTTQVTLRRQQGADTERLIESMGSRSPAASLFLQLPTLVAPEGSTVWPQGGGGGGDDVTQTARVETRLDRGALTEHYAAQLRAVGWRLVNRADVGQVTSTVWSFTQGGQERVGLLILAGTSPYRATLMTQGAR